MVLEGTYVGASVAEIWDVSSSEVSSMAVESFCTSGPVDRELLMLATPRFRKRSGPTSILVVRKQFE